MTYWTKVLQSRITRRRGLATMGAASAAAAFLAACGGDDGGSNGTGGEGTGMITLPVDTAKSAVRGGTLSLNAGEPLHWDGSIQQGQLNIYNSLAYGSLVQNKGGHMQPTTYTEVVGDLAESWEWAPDGMSITFKLRQGVKWANVAPVSGRDFDADDVVANWTRYEAKGGNRNGNANKANPSAPIVSVTATDKYTVVYKLARPTSFLLQRLGTMVTGEAGTQMPRETDVSFDPKTEQIGTGAFVREKYEPSIGVSYKKNPNYWNQAEPYVDGIRFAILPEYASQLAQLQTGNLHTLNPPVLAPDVLPTFKSREGLKLYSYLAATPNPGPMVGFGWYPTESGEKSPFLDVRVRRAFALSQDRDTFIDVFSNVQKFEAEGLPMETYYNTAMGYVPGITLDPRKSEFGPNAKYYTFNPEEAKKLLSAAYPNGVPAVTSRFNTIAFFGADHQQQVEVVDNFAREVGFKISTLGIDYNLEYLPKYVSAQGKNDGYVYRWGAPTSLDPVDYYVWRYYSKSGPTSGALGFGGPDGSLGDQSGDPVVDGLIEKAVAEVDSAKRISLIHDIQRQLAGQQYGITRGGMATQFLLAWDAVQNFQVVQGDSRNSPAHMGYYTWWLDQKRAPFV